MENRDLKKHNQGGGREKQPYEPPQATSVRVQLEERVLGCNFSSVRLCGYTE